MVGAGSKLEGRSVWRGMMTHADPQTLRLPFYLPLLSRAMGRNSTAQSLTENLSALVLNSSEFSQPSPHHTDSPHSRGHGELCSPFHILMLHQTGESSNFFSLGHAGQGRLLALACLNARSHVNRRARNPTFLAQ
ncbi:hypothetical protein Mp_7g11650 [Marchantia polymorpha subsp. ruderalis]|uniref:Uncharacterized protein n=2 Tax=Marchantia polymorpha TaxID=3197 RepID=A0AAF6BYH9_MARPO|nr:hypothetical protein MARPO_0003s0177 [Marchantia polymorpha]BBN17063.1 hypothetical protein Mp_7g11650 [Marchantia polymorpha subsp. ruderalis]|eukprot:PTQ49298.1 hypothetical protein MARPO_0003s0177 [Marchantia polymorpha]